MPGFVFNWTFDILGFIIFSMTNSSQNNRPYTRTKNIKMAVWALILSELLGIFLCFSSIFNTYKDIYTHEEIHFGDLFGVFDDTIYTVEINEIPEELYPSFYILKIGDNALIITGIDDYLEELDQTGSVIVRGQLQSFSTEEEDIKQAAWDYFTENGYFENDSKVKQRVAHHYLECSDFGFIGVMLDDHPFGLIFGLSIFLVIGMMMYPYGLLYIIRHYYPACGSVKYTTPELEEQMKRPETEKVDYADLYFTPEILIGTQIGMTAVRYDDIEKVYTRKKLHINWDFPKNFLYHTHQIIVVCKNHKKLTMCDVTFLDQSLIDRVSGTVNKM